MADYTLRHATSDDVGSIVILVNRAFAIESFLRPATAPMKPGFANYCSTAHFSC